MEDRRAHERIDGIEISLKKHYEDHERIEQSLVENTRLTKENTELTKTIAENTTEIVEIVKGFKLFRHLVLWVTPILIAFAAIYEWIKWH